MRDLLLVVNFLLLIQNNFSQNNVSQYNFHPPLDIPMYLSGSFAELRTNHFHSGIDIKTQGVTGKNVFSIEDGHVSRIKVQTNGYGKSVYINHPGGFTTVYAHLKDYSKKIDNYVKNYQYRNQTHEVDIYPSPDDLPVGKGEQIGWSGNSGSSGGPHLHFEIREAATQRPLNVLDYGFDIKDNISPTIYSLFLYKIEREGQDRVLSSRKEYRLSNSGNHYYIQDTPVCEGSIAFGLESYDFINGSGNRCGVYSLKLFVNEDLHYHFRADRFSFAESRYINAHMDYALKSATGRRTHNLFIMPNEKLSMNMMHKGSGVIEMSEDSNYDIEIQVRDNYDNLSTLKFRVVGKEPFKKEISVEENLPSLNPGNSSFFKWYHSNHFTEKNVKLSIPPNALYENLDFEYEEKIRNHSFYPYVHSLHNERAALHTYSTLAINIKDVPREYHGKLCVVKLNPDNKVEFEGGKINQDWISAGIREFGDYTLEIDTLAPEIRPLNIGNRTNMQGNNTIWFTVEDDLSGIDEYKAYIDNQWVLLEYDPKTAKIYYEFDSSRIKNDSWHELEVYVSDKMKNKNIYHTTFYW